MTNHQDKELSGDLYENWVAYAKRGGLLDADGKATDSEKAQTSWYAWEACHKQSATSPQLPVAEQPAGLAVPLCWVPEDELPESMTTEAYSALYPYSRVDVIREFPIYAAPHSPVAQMSGDEAMERAVSAAMVVGNKHDVSSIVTARILAAYQTIALHPFAAASHPSNADTELLRSKYFALSDKAGKLIADISGGAVDVSPTAATVPQVVQAPSAMVDELLRIARLIEALKKPCSDDPESPQAIRNGQYQSIALMVRALAAAPQPVAASPSIVPILSDEFIQALIDQITNLSGRDSPDYDPDAMVVTGKELDACIRNVEEIFEDMGKSILTTASNAGEAAPAAIDVRDADCFSRDGDIWHDCPDDSAFVHGLKVGDEYEVYASCRAWTERYRVTKAPDDDSDDYEVERVSPPQTGNAGEAVKGGA